MKVELPDWAANSRIRTRMALVSLSEPSAVCSRLLTCSALVMVAFRPDN